jgi:hypothetical protein
MESRTMPNNTSKILMRVTMSKLFRIIMGILFYALGIYIMTESLYVVFTKSEYKYIFHFLIGTTIAVYGRLHLRKTKLTEQ